MLNYLRVLQLNTRSLKSNKDLIEALLYKEKIDIAILCETWLKTNENINITNFESATKNRDDGYGGFAILTKKGWHSR